MNIAPVLFDALLPVVMTFLPLLLLVAGFKLYQPIIIGWIGEGRVRAVLDGLDGDKYIHFHDVLLPIDGETTQIDHVLIVGDTCFVIETKAYAGWIFGNANAKQWTQMFNKRSKFQFQNPIRQNYKHILAIKPFLEGLKVVGVVVFTRGTFKSPRIDNVLYCNELKPYLFKHEENKAFDNQAAVQTLQKHMITDKKEHKAHVLRLQKKYGGRWRIPVANTLLVTSLALFIGWVGFDSKPAVEASTPQKTQLQPVYKPPQSSLPQGVAAPSPTIKPQPMAKPPVVNGFAEGKVIIPNGRSFRVLKVGERTGDGWKLEVADATSAEFSNAAGQSIKVSVRQRGVSK